MSQKKAEKIKELLKQRARIQESIKIRKVFRKKVSRDESSPTLNISKSMSPVKSQ